MHSHDSLRQIVPQMRVFKPLEKHLIMCIFSVLPALSYLGSPESPERKLENLSASKSLHHATLPRPREMVTLLALPSPTPYSEALYQSSAGNFFVGLGFSLATGQPRLLRWASDLSLAWRVGPADSAVVGGLFLKESRTHAFVMSRTAI